MKYISIFKALGDETRLRIINLFVQSRERLCVCEMVDSLQLPQYTISKALTILRNAGLIISGKQGTWVYNKLSEDSKFLIALYQILRKHLKTEYPHDLDRLKKRLSLRENGVCVIGVPLKDRLDVEFEKRRRKDRQ